MHCAVTVEQAELDHPFMERHVVPVGAGLAFAGLFRGLNPLKRADHSRIGGDGGDILVAGEQHHILSGKIGRRVRLSQHTIGAIRVRREGRGERVEGEHGALGVKLVHDLINMTASPLSRAACHRAAENDPEDFCPRRKCAFDRP